MARSLRSLSGSGLTAAPTPRSILAPSMKARACHHPSRQRQPSLTCDPVSNHAQPDHSPPRFCMLSLMKPDHLPPALLLTRRGQLAHVHVPHARELGTSVNQIKTMRAASITSI